MQAGRRRSRPPSSFKQLVVPIPTVVLVLLDILALYKTTHPRGTSILESIPYPSKDYDTFEQSLLFPLPGLRDGRTAR